VASQLPSCEIAEHATDDALTPAEINVLRLIAAGNANKQIADQLSITEETVKRASQEHPFQIRRQRQNPSGNDRLKRGIIEL
jgi:FixJ family two-component response regulator